MSEHEDGDSSDPVVCNPAFYRTVFENSRVRVLEYRDSPGDRARPHRHPDSVMVTLGPFRRLISNESNSVEVELDGGEVRWLDAQEHWGENIGSTETHTIFVELKEPGSDERSSRLGPASS